MNESRELERGVVEPAVADYYSSLTESEMEEHALWGEFAMEQVSDEQA
jgi:hypothetical protein